MEERFRDPEAEHAAAVEILDIVTLHVFAWARLQRASEVTT